jgi:hypothetical protein
MTINKTKAKPSQAKPSQAKPNPNQPFMQKIVRCSKKGPYIFLKRGPKWDIFYKQANLLAISHADLAVTNAD